MRHRAKEASVGPITAAARSRVFSGVSRRSSGIAGALLLACCVLGIAASSAVAGQVRLQIGSFDGSATSAGSFGSYTRLAVDQTQGALYVLDRDHGVIDKFDASGTPQSFSALGGPELDGAGSGQADETPQGSLESPTYVAVDNSGGSTDGNLYVSSESGRLYAFDSSGAFLWSIDGSGPPASGGTPTGSLDSPCGLAVDPAGAIYIAGREVGAVRKFTPTVGTASYDSDIAPVLEESFGRSPCEIAVDGLGHLFAIGFVGYKVDLTTGSVLLNYSQDDGKIDTAFTVDSATNHAFLGHYTYIKEFDSSDTEIGIPFARTEHGYQSLAVYSASDRVFASTDPLASLPNSVLVFGPVVTTTPPVTSINPPSAVTANSAHLSGSVDPNGFPTGWYFEYSTNGTDWTKTAADQDAGDGSADVPVAIDLAGLDPNTHYFVRLVAANTGGDESISTEEAFTTEPAPPIVEPLFAANVTTTSALLGGKVNARNSSTTYYVEYSQSPDFAASLSVPATKDALVGSGDSLVALTVEIAGLVPDTTYHFRLIAENQAGKTIGSSRSFTTLVSEPPNVGLPDDRVYEKASPLEKHGADLFGGDLGSLSLSAAAESGDAVTYWSRINFGDDSDGGILAVPYISHRDGSGWMTKGISPQVDARPTIGQFAGYQWFSPDLSKGVLVTAASINPGDPKGIYNSYLRDTRSDEYRLLSVHDPDLVPSPSVELNALYPPMFVDATRDGSHVLFQPIHQLMAEGPPGSCGLYEWVGGEVRPVGILPDGTLASTAVPGTDSRCESNVGYSGANVISDDGSRIYFSLREGSLPQPTREGTNGNGSSGALYVRENGSTTRHVSASEAPGPEPSEIHVHFELARASDGAVAFFTDDEKRTADAVPGTNLYRWDANAPAGSRLTDITTSDPLGAAVIDVLAANDEATSVYFRSTGLLAPGGVRGQVNNYLWKEGSGVRYVTRGGGIDGARKQATPVRGEIRITPSGGHMLFESSDRLTAYDNGGYTQLYLYDADEDELECVSCNPRTESSQGDAEMFAMRLPSAVSTRNLSSDGRRVFFNTAEALVSHDTNGRKDVYEWVNGRLHLISSGTSKADSLFLDASLSGDDVFFTTEEPLVRSDTDDLIDVYDARVGGKPEPAVIPGCLGDECQGTPNAPPVFADPATSTYVGPGAHRPSRRSCRRKVRRVRHGKGRCVRRHRPGGKQAQRGQQRKERVGR